MARGVHAIVVDTARKMPSFARKMPSFARKMPEFKNQKARKALLHKALRACGYLLQRYLQRVLKKNAHAQERRYATARLRTRYTPPPASPVGERRLRRRTALHAHARAAVPLAPVAALGFLGLLLLPLGHLGRSHDRLDRAGHVVGLMACLAGR